MSLHGGGGGGKASPSRFGIGTFYALFYINNLQINNEYMLLFVFEMLIKFSLFICLLFWKSSRMEITDPVFVYWLCQVLYISVHRCHCWLGLCYFLCCVFFFVFRC
jgi:hypothetical protein